MLCVYCGHKTSVVNSRRQKGLNSIWRRRYCPHCQNTFTTHENAKLADSWVFVDAQRNMQPFIAEKLLLSLYESLKHRPTALEDATALQQTALRQLADQLAHAQLQRQQVIQTVHKLLERFDQAAAVHYAAFHHS